MALEAMEAMHEVGRLFAAVYPTRDSPLMKELTFRNPICGIYFLTRRGEVVYVGSSVDIEDRVFGHVCQRVKGFDGAFYFECDEGLLCEYEPLMIEHFKPMYNSPFEAPSAKTLSKIKIADDMVRAIVSEAGDAGICLGQLWLRANNRGGIHVDSGVIFRAAERDPGIVWDVDRAVYVAKAHTPCTISSV